MDTTNIIQSLDELIKTAKHPQDVEKLKDFLEVCLDPTTASHKRSWNEISHQFISLSLGERDQFQEYIKLGEEVQEWMYSLGYRSNIMTLQEHNMIGSSGTNNSEDIDPYTPIGLVEDGLTLGEVKTARDLEKHFLSYSIGFIFNEGDSQQDVIPVSLEPLGNDGKTIRDPQPLDKDLRVISNYSVEFIPYQREL
jgi:hypothetical protein